MNKYNIQILGIIERRWTGNGVITTYSRNTIIYSGREDNKQREGVAIDTNGKEKLSRMGAI